MDSTIDGFPVGVRNSEHFVNLGVDPDSISSELYYVDVAFVNVDQQFENTDAKSHVKSSADLYDFGVLFESDAAQFTRAPGFLEDALDIGGTKIDSLGEVNTSSAIDPHQIEFYELQAIIAKEGYWDLPDGRLVTVVDQYIADRVTGEIAKTSLFIEIPGPGDLIPNPDLGITEFKFNGVLDVNNVGPTANDDFATVSAGTQSVTLDVIANDTDPEGDALAIDGYLQPENGIVTLNEDGTVTYTADPLFEGVDEFTYWVEDKSGNFTQGVVQVSVEI